MQRVRALTAELSSRNKLLNAKVGDGVSIIITKVVLGNAHHVHHSILAVVLD